MFNLQPGQGLGTTPSRLLAFGLGGVTVVIIPIVYRDIKGGGGLAAGDLDLREHILRDDDEIIGFIIQITTSGIL